MYVHDPNLIVSGYLSSKANEVWLQSCRYPLHLIFTTCISHYYYFLLYCCFMAPTRIQSIAYLYKQTNKRDRQTNRQTWNFFLAPVFLLHSIDIFYSLLLDAVVSCWYNICCSVLWLCVFVKTKMFLTSLLLSNKLTFLSLYVTFLLKIYLRVWMSIPV
jgi:hypothetical protein